MNKNLDTELHIDFASSSNNFRRLHGGGRGQPIARAIGLKNYGLPLKVIDCTAGLGQDAFVLATLGCEVTLIERAPLIAAELADALLRAAAVPELHEIVARMQLITGDSIAYLTNLRNADHRPDVIYLDPMFPLRTKTALVKQEMRILKELVGEDLDADQLLQLALGVAKRRIVVKRPRIAEYLAGIKPHASQVGKANRFDIYMPK